MKEQCMLEFQNISFSYSKEPLPMFQDLSFQVEKGAFVSMIGASGCGKSTLFRLINGLEKPSGGTIFVDGQPIAHRKRYCAYMPQKDMLFPWRTIGDNVALPLEMDGQISKKERREKSLAVLESVGLAHVIDKYPRELSGGMRQRVSFARTLMVGSDLLLLDEPFSALDSISRISLQQWLMEQWEKQEKTVLFITHDVEEALFLSSHILVVSGRPVTGLEELTVPLTYPRNRSMLAQKEILECKETLIEKLRQEGSL